MQLRKIDLADTHAFSSFFLDYVSGRETLTPFYHHPPTVRGIGAQVEQKKSFPAASREVLVRTLRKQYATLKPTGAVAASIEALGQPTTFTITTGHQLNIFTGPLYFVYKIVTVINACKQLKKAYPQYEFVPVYWMASEDHDYEEIKSFRLAGKKYTWETDQTGAVGRFAPTGLAALAKSLPADASLFAKAYAKNPTLAEAVREYVHGLFEAEGVVVMDADDADLKRLFLPVMHADILEQQPAAWVAQTNQRLEAAGYHPQVHARDINFFYLAGSTRSRIEKQGAVFRVVDSALVFTADEIKQRMHDHPDEFSPNVILRPLYQEMILPNVAYVGGPAEMVYWLQLKRVFEEVGQPFPVLLPRNFALVVDAPTARKQDKTGLDLPLFFHEKNYLYNHWVLKHSQATVSTSAEQHQVAALFQALRARAGAIDATLQKNVEAQAQRVTNALAAIETKMLRAEKRKQADKLRQIEAVKDQLFPQGGLQERSDNLLNFYPADPNFLTHLLAHFDPFDFRFHVLTYDQG
ncbi:MAG: bacillithiol biosynthesis cysteine-adding enzyme BshC [Cyclobacteriaceae bacterium]|jgi:bacillithiol biosynthesis cysteine-adding enzyme BshC|nr:bacillithiol biosynthesis cysteine-adding enzyme BshC [Cyclobacteriaceae bacterium]